MKVLITGSQGFIGSYLCEEFLARNYDVVGIDNYSKYGYVVRNHDKHPNFNLINYDLTTGFPDVSYDYLVLGAAMIGGISYFHKYAYDLISANERIMANSYDHAVKTKPKKVVVISSSMVFENDTNLPSAESNLLYCPSPSSTYGMQKLMCEYWAYGAYEQYGIPYAIVRPFNCVGVGEYESKNDDKIAIGNVEMMMSHVIPDLVHRTLKTKPDEPFHILGDGNQIRHYTNGKDIALGIRLALEYSDVGSFNISSNVPTSVNELVDFIWLEIHGARPKVVINEKPFRYDVQVRSPDTTRASELLGFNANIQWKDSVKEVIKWMCQ